MRPRPEQHEVGAAGRDVDRQRAHAGRDAFALGDDQAHAVVHLVDEPQRELDRRSAWRRRGGTAAPPCRARATNHVGPDHVAEPDAGHAPRLRERAGDHERPLLVEHRQRRPVGELARTPRRRPPARERSRAGRRCARPARPDRSGCSASVRNIDVRVRGVDHPPHLGGVEREVGVALALDHGRADDPGDLGVHLVRGLERRDGAPGAGEREQDRLQHLVRPVGGEHHVGATRRAARRSPARSSIACRSG